MQYRGICFEGERLKVDIKFLQAGINLILIKSGPEPADTAISA